MNAIPMSPRHHPAVEREPLPAETKAALKAIANDLRNMPRDCIGDRAELIHWLNRLARRVEAERDRMVVVANPGAGARKPLVRHGLGWCPPERSPCPLAAATTPRERAEAVFKVQSQPSTLPPKPRTVVSRKGRTVRVEVRRARAFGQLEMPL